PLGFFANGDRIASIAENKASPRTSVLHVWEVTSGKLQHDFPLTGGMWDYHFSPQHSVLVGEMPTTLEAAPRYGALDLGTGQWTELAAAGATVLQFHPSRAWVLLLLRDEADGHVEAIVSDLHTGNRVFTLSDLQARKSGRRFAGQALFLPQS